MDNKDLRNTTKLKAFNSKEDSSNNKVNNDSSPVKKTNGKDNLLNQEVVTRPLLWGLVVFLVFFSLVIGAVSVYRMLQTLSLVEDIPAPMRCRGDRGERCALPSMESDSLMTTPITTDTNKEADLIESEIQSIDQDLEENIYSE